MLPLPFFDFIVAMQQRQGRMPPDIERVGLLHPDVKAEMMTVQKKHDEQLKEEVERKFYMGTARGYSKAKPESDQAAGGWQSPSGEHWKCLTHTEVALCYLLYTRVAFLKTEVTKHLRLSTPKTTLTAELHVFSYHHVCASCTQMLHVFTIWWLEVVGVPLRVVATALHPYSDDKSPAVSSSLFWRVEADDYSSGEPASDTRALTSPPTTLQIVGHSLIAAPTGKAWLIHNPRIYS